MAAFQLVPDNTNEARCRRLSAGGGGWSSETNKTATPAKEKQQVKERRRLQWFALHSVSSQRAADTSNVGLPNEEATATSKQERGHP